MRFDHGENEEGWNDLKSNALWHHLLHRTTAKAKPGDGAPKIFGAYKLGRAKARLATGQGLSSDIKESLVLDPVLKQILGVTSNADEPTENRDAQTTDAATTPNQIRRTPSRDYVILQETLQSMVGLSIRFLVEIIFPDVDATFTSFENAELWQQGRWASSGFARATFHPDLIRAEWEFALAEHKWAASAQQHLARLVHCITAARGRNAEGRIHLHRRPAPIRLPVRPIDYITYADEPTVRASVAEQGRREAGGAAVETITFHIHPQAADRRRHSRCGGTEPTSSSPHGAAEQRITSCGEQRDGQGSV
eukprot:6213128-Pleurochrysis_carterae.AAC.2